MTVTTSRAAQCSGTRFVLAVQVVHYLTCVRRV